MISVCKFLQGGGERRRRRSGPRSRGRSMASKPFSQQCNAKHVEFLLRTRIWPREVSPRLEVYSSYPFKSMLHLGWSTTTTSTIGPSLTASSSFIVGYTSLCVAVDSCRDFKRGTLRFGGIWNKKASRRCHRTSPIYSSSAFLKVMENQ